MSPLERWAGPSAQTTATGIVLNVNAMRPWAAPENEQNLPENQKDSKHWTVVKPPCYDSNPTIVESMITGNVIKFNDVPVGETTVRAATFRSVACFPLTFRATSGPGAPYRVFSPGGSVTATPSRTSIWTETRFWFSFTGDTAGVAAPNEQVTIHCNETNQDFIFTLTGNTIARPTVAVMMALDQSGSMDDPAGSTGVKRIQALRDAAGLFVDTIEPDNAIGLIRFDTLAYAVDDATFPGLDLTTIGAASAFDPGRTAARTAVARHATNIAGNTSIGAGVLLARNMLNPATGFTNKALIVFTDGIENTAPFIRDVLASINQQTFAVGLGDVHQVSSDALTALSNRTKGYTLLTGQLSASLDDYFLLRKYFLQILAGVTNTEIVNDPVGFITAGAQVQVPFELNETDIEATVVLMTDIPAVDIAVTTPAGQVISPGTVAGMNVTYVRTSSVRYYRFTLPVAMAGGAQTGRWVALLTLDERLFKELRGNSESDGARYSLTALAWSNLRLRARATASGSTAPLLSITAFLDEYGIPVSQRANVLANLTLPDGMAETLQLKEGAPGNFKTSVTGKLTGVYRFHVIANGTTFRSEPFTREQLLTCAVSSQDDAGGQVGRQDHGH